MANRWLVLNFLMLMGRRVLAAMLTIFALSACSSSVDKADKKNEVGDTELTAVANRDDDALFPFDLWATEKPKAVNMDIVNIVTTFGIEPTKTEDALDYYGNAAKKYRFREEVEYLDVIDSDSLLEVNWFKADRSDLPQGKSIAIENTHKAYQFAHNLMGNQGGEMVKSIVSQTADSNNQDYDSKSFAGINVLTAGCDYFDCHYIVKK